MKIAVIDCGTNTFNLLVADAFPDHWDVIFQSKLPVKLGMGGFEEHEIVPSRFMRGLDALLSHRETIRNYQCDKIFAYATSAIREAKNGADFVARAKKLFDIDIEVIDGDREAELIYEGVKQTIQFTSGPALIMDIGGGSTEFIIADQSGILWKRSFLLGVSRLHDKIKPEDKMSAADLSYLEELLTKDLKPLAVALSEYKVSWLVGSSGSFDTLLALYFADTNQNLVGLKPSNEISLKALPKVHQWLMNSTYEERLKNPVIPSIRAEYMPLASYLVKHVLAMNKFEKLFHSSYSLKEGAMSEILRRIEWPAPIIDEKPEDYLEE